MPREVTFKNFYNGIDTDEDKAFNYVGPDIMGTGFVAAANGVDIYGTGGGTSTNAPHRVGLYQPSQRMVAETEAAAANDITDLIQWVYPFNGKTYGISDVSRFYESSTALGGTWTLKFATSASTGGAGLMPFGSNMYYGQDTVLGKFDGTNSNHNFKTFNSSTAGPRPMAIIAGRLAVGNQRNIATLEADETTFNATRLQLPVGYVARSMEVWNNFLAIAADFTPPSATNPINSRLFLWNGTSATYTEALELPFTSAPLLINNDNILWIIGGDKSSNMLIFAYNGSSLHQSFFITDVVPHGLGSRSKFQGNIIFGTNGRTNSNNGGVWMIGGGQEQKPYALSMPFLLSPAGGITATNVGGLYGEANNLLAAWYDGTNYGIDKTSNAVFPNTGAYLVTLPLHFGEPTKNKMLYGLKVDLQNPGSVSGANLQIQYKLNFASSWTTLKTIYATDANLAPYIPLGRQARRTEVRFNWTTSASNNPLQIRSFSFFYDLVPNTF